MHQDGLLSVCECDCKRTQKWAQYQVIIEMSSGFTNYTITYRATHHSVVGIGVSSQMRSSCISQLIPKGKTNVLSSEMRLLF